MIEITEKQYLSALALVKAYESQEYKKTNSKISKIIERLDSFFKDTNIKVFDVIQEDESTINVYSIDPQYDEDYSGEFDKDMEKMSIEFQVQINFEPYNYGK